MARTPTTITVDVIPTQALNTITEQFRQMTLAARKVFSEMYGDPVRAENRRLLLTATVHLDSGLRDARTTLAPDALREELRDLPMESRLYVSGRMDLTWTEADLVNAAAWLTLAGSPRCSMALLEGWADRG